MIAVAELLNKDRLPGNYFASDAYVQGDFELGLLENRQGNRLVALPETLLQALYSSLEDEVGSAAGLVMFQCGHWWGKYFYRRFAEEISTYYKKPLAEMEMVEFLQCLKQCWKTYGWGNLNLEFKHYTQGYIIATVENSAFAEARKKNENAPKKPACYTEAGLLSTFFSQLTGQNLHCVQTTCESMGAAENTFILGLEERLKVAEDCVEEQQDHDTIMVRLGLDQTDVAESPETLVSERPEASFTAVETPITEPTEIETVSLASTAASEMLADVADMDALDSIEQRSEETLVPSVESVNIEDPEAFTQDTSEESQETSERPEASVPAAEFAEEDTEAAEAPIESADALEMLTDLPDLEALENVEEMSEDMTAPPVEDISTQMPEAFTQNVSEESDETSEMPEASFLATEFAEKDTDEFETPEIESEEALEMLTSLPEVEALDSAEEISEDTTIPAVEDINIQVPDAFTQDISEESEKTAEMPEASFPAAEFAAEDTEAAEAPIESADALEMLADLPDLEALDHVEETSEDMTFPPVGDISTPMPDAFTQNVSEESEGTSEMPEASVLATEFAVENTEKSETPELESEDALEMLTSLPEVETLDGAEEISEDMTMPAVEDINIQVPDAFTQDISEESEKTAEMPEASFPTGEFAAEDTEAAEASIESADALEMLTDLPDLEALDHVEEMSEDMTMPPVEDISTQMPAAFTQHISEETEGTSEMPETSFPVVALAAEDTEKVETPEIESEDALEMLTDLPDLEALEHVDERSENMTLPSVEDVDIQGPDAFTQDVPEGSPEMAEHPALEMIDEPTTDESPLSSDSLEALDNLAGLADFDGFNELENLGE